MIIINIICWARAQQSCARQRVEPGGRFNRVTKHCKALNIDDDDGGEATYIHQWLGIIMVFSHFFALVWIVRPCAHSCAPLLPSRVIFQGPASDSVPPFNANVQRQCLFPEFSSPPPSSSSSSSIS